jgi:plastocyanin
LGLKNRPFRHGAGMCEAASTQGRFPQAAMARTTLIAALLLTSAGTAFAADPAHTVIQAGRAFHPAEITINRGESLTFTNNDQFIHQIYALGQFDSEEKSPGENLTESFTQNGTFEVHCHIHPKMKLVVHVK